MMLEINLLPGARKSSRRARGLALPSSLSAVTADIRDPWLLGATISVAIAAAAVGLLFTTQSARADELGIRLEGALRDSTRYAMVLDARMRLTTERDSVYRQLQIIRTIDDNRYTWAHILDEVSRALPAYTWLTAIEQTSKAPAPPGAATPAVPQSASSAKATAKDTAEPVDSLDVHPPLTFRVVGQTVDIQALTMFMRQLESSPFVQQVALTKSEIVIVDGKDITQFELAATYEIPPADVIQTSPLVVPVR